MISLNTDHLSGFIRYLQVLKGLSTASVEVYCSKVKEFFAWLEGNDDVKPVEEITRPDIERYLEWCYYKGNSNQTRHTKLTALDQFFRYLLYEKIISADVTAEIPKPKIFSRRLQTFTREEVLNFFRAVDITTEKGLRDVCIFILAVFCGLRISELYRLRLGDIIEDEGAYDIAIPEDIGKKHHSRTIWLWKSPSAFIRAYVTVRINHGAKINDTFFISYRFRRPSTRPLDASALNLLLSTYAKRAGIRKTRITWHMFRATHANDLQHVEGFTLPAIMERLGWKDLSTAGRYLVRRERIHRLYQSLYQYWLEFNKLWKGEQQNDDNGKNLNVAGSHGAAHGGNTVDGKS
jgi:integrase/recombinase XerD